MRQVQLPKMPDNRAAYEQLCQHGRDFYQQWFQPWDEREPVMDLVKQLRVFDSEHTSSEAKTLRVALGETELDARRRRNHPSTQ